MRIGITGRRGVLGSRIADALDGHGHEVVAFDGDVRDLGAVKAWVSELDVVVHAAALVPVTEVTARPFDAVATNVGGTANIAQGVSESPGCRLVYISTSHVYRSTEKALAESDPVEAASLYGLSKLQGEQWIERLLSDYLTIRVFSFFDERQSPPYLVPSLAQRLRGAAAGAELDLQGADNIRDIADASFLGEICARLVMGGTTGTVNCGTGRGHSIYEIATELARSMNRSDVRWRRVSGSPKNILVAETSELRHRLAGGGPEFDLADSLARYGAARAEIREC